MGMPPAELAARLGVPRTTYLGWEADDPKKPNFPAEEAMAQLCEMKRGLTLDYLYRGVYGSMPLGLAIRLTAREMGLDPDRADTRDAAARVAAAVGAEQG